MTRRERLERTLRGESVDRPPVSFYEIGFFNYSAADSDPYNVHNDPSWQPLLDLARDRTDIIRAAQPKLRPAPGADGAARWRVETETRGASRFTRATLKLPRRTLTQTSRRDAATDTVWQTEHLFKDKGDVEAFLEVPPQEWAVTVDCAPLFATEAELGDSGIVCVDTPDPLCCAAAQFDMAEYTVFALTEPECFHRLLAHHCACLLPTVAQTAREFSGRLWRIYGPEYAAEPYLPPRLFKEYVNGYTGHLVAAISRHGGYVRIHSHGRLRAILPHIAALEPAGLDPIEPPPQGDMELIEVRRAIGQQTVLFGNLEVSDIENLPPAVFKPKVAQALREGTVGRGRGFVLMPSASPYGRTIRPSVLENYRLMVELAESFDLSAQAPDA